MSNDFLQGTSGFDTFIGSAGNDTIDGLVGVDTVDYGNLTRSGSIPQNITFSPIGFFADQPSAAAVQKGTLGTDRLISIERVIANAGAANNTINVSTAAAGISIEVSLAGGYLLVNSVPNIGTLELFVTNFDNVIGTNGDDNIIGDSQDNLLRGGAGNDSINGWTGNDTVQGGAGDDILRGMSGDDSINGGSGNDILRGEYGNDTLIGGSGSDTFVYNDPGEGGDTITDWGSNDFIQLRSSSFGFAGLNSGTLSANRYGEGNSVESAVFAAKNAGASGAAVLGVSDGANVQVWYTSSTSDLSGLTLLATLTDANLGNISQNNFSVIV